MTMLKMDNKSSDFSIYSCQPKTKKELKDIINDRISKEGPNCDLNDIDVSLIDDMSELFFMSDFNGDISKWNVSNVENMRCMFISSKFNQDISKWNVSKVKHMYCMFEGSKFNHDISNWKIDKNCDVFDMFYDCPIRKKFKPKSL